jgi:hypothetical protein
MIGERADVPRKPLSAPVPTCSALVRWGSKFAGPPATSARLIYPNKRTFLQPAGHGEFVPRADVPLHRSFVSRAAVSNFSSLRIAVLGLACVLHGTPPIGDAC